MSHALLSHTTKILDKYKSDGVSEIMVNQPGEVWIDKNGSMSKILDENITPDNMKNLAFAIAGTAGQEISNLKPLVSATLPIYLSEDVIKGGERVQIVHPPLVPSNQIAIAMRIPSTKRFTLDDYKKSGAFENIKKLDSDDKLRKHYKQKNWYRFLIEAVKQKKNIINSGGTSTGKTTFSNTLTTLMGLNERLIIIEDSSEIKAEQQNKLNLLTSTEKKDSNGVVIAPKITPRELIEASLRLRPDRIIQGELRGAEAFDFLRAINSGHPGSISTIHADTATGALNALEQLVMQAGMGWNGKEIKKYIMSVVDVVIQWRRQDDKRYISEIWWRES